MYFGITKCDLKWERNNQYMPQTLWILEATKETKFPYLATITRDDKILLRLRVQDRWPGQKGHVFCVRVPDDIDWPVLDEIERVPVTSLRRYGKRLAVVLDRPKNKRCDFLFITKEYKTKAGHYEQIFWRTERGLKERKPRVKLSTYTNRELTIAVDSGERYAWNFPGHTVTREQLVKLKEVLGRHAGPVPAFLHFLDPREEAVLALPPDLGLTPSAALVEEVNRLLGYPALSS